jgi:hypothetical protein
MSCSSSAAAVAAAAARKRTVGSIGDHPRAHHDRRPAASTEHRNAGGQGFQAEPRARSHAVTQARLGQHLVSASIPSGELHIQGLDTQGRVRVCAVKAQRARGNQQEGSSQVMTKHSPRGGTAMSNATL